MKAIPTVNIARPLHRLAALVAVLLMATALTACSSDKSSDQKTATHAVKNEFGTAQIPDNPRSVVVLDEYAAMNLLSLGIVPKVVFTGYGSTISQQILRQAGSKIVNIPVGSTIKSTTILSHDPDLVVFSSVGDRTVYDQLAPTVPTLPLPLTDDWRKKFTTTAKALGKQPRAQYIIGVLDKKIAAVKKSRGPSSPATVSVLMSYAGGLSSISGGAPVGTLLTEAGFTTPKAEKRKASGDQPHVDVSPENLVDHDADVISILDEGVYKADAVRKQPTFSRLTGHAVNVNGDMWFGTFPFAVFWTVTDFEAIERGDWSAIATEKDAAQRYAQYRKLIG